MKINTKYLLQQKPIIQLEGGTSIWNNIYSQYLNGKGASVNMRIRIQILASHANNTRTPNFEEVNHINENSKLPWINFAEVNNGRRTEQILSDTCWYDIKSALGQRILCLCPNIC